MGLDIYLYKYEDFENTLKREEEYEKFSEESWENAGDYNSLTEEEKAEINKKCEEFAASLDLDKYGRDNAGKLRIEVDHKKWSDHLFKLGYFRSSYNGGGIERILRNMGLPTLHEVFGKDTNDEYYFKPDWNESLVRINDLIERFSKENGNRVVKFQHNPFIDMNELPSSETDALAIFKEHFEKQNDYNYSSKEGDFFINEPMEVLALIPGKTSRYLSMIETPCFYAVIKGDNEFYAKALEIVRDTINYVLEQSDKEKYYFHWSG